MYRVECQCGHSIPVELWQAGTAVRCGRCNAEAAVPNTITLKEQSGDKYPFLNPLQKIVQTLANEEAPFDGACHGCSDKIATIQVPVTFKVLQERSLDHDGQIRPMLGGVSLAAAGGEETWQTVTFPLLLCNLCRDRFAAEQRSARIRQVIGQVVALALGVGCLWFAYHNAEVVAAAAGVISLIGGIAWMVMHRLTQTVAPYLEHWLQNIRWIPDAIAGEEEFEITAGQPQAYESETIQ